MEERAAVWAIFRGNNNNALDAFFVNNCNAQKDASKQYSDGRRRVGDGSERGGGETEVTWWRLCRFRCSCSTSAIIASVIRSACQSNRRCAWARATIAWSLNRSCSQSRSCSRSLRVTRLLLIYNIRAAATIWVYVSQQQQQNRTTNANKKTKKKGEAEAVEAGRAAHASWGAAGMESESESEPEPPAGVVR